MSASIFFQKELEPTFPSVTKEKCWWDHDETLNAIEEEERVNPLCQCQGYVEQKYEGVCSLHPPTNIKHIRALIKNAREEAYDQGGRKAVRDVLEYLHQSEIPEENER